jgi:hypothetical protein
MCSNREKWGDTEDAEFYATGGRGGKAGKLGAMAAALGQGPFPLLLLGDSLQRWRF